MSSNCPEHNPLQRDGLNQAQRQLAALLPSYVGMDERGLPELLEFTAKYAEKIGIKFFDLHNAADNGETWQQLMDYRQFFADAQNLEPELAQRQDYEPHFALLLTFLRLFGIVQSDLNQLTQRHLDFYYQEVLQLALRPPTPDRVHLVFELAKNMAEQIVPSAIELDAGKDAGKQPLTYISEEELVVNRAGIAHLRTVYRPAGGKVFYAPAANTADGVAKALPEADPTWNAFGPKLNPATPCGAGSVAATVGLPEARLGFALASPVLLLAEGDRLITVTFTTAATAPVTLAGKKLNIQLSGQKAWIDAPQTSFTVSGQSLAFTVRLGPEVKEAAVGYQATKLEGNYTTELPILRAWLADTADYALLAGVVITHAKVDATVTGLKKSLIVENDFGKLNPEKPFPPFGPTPTIGSACYVGCPEAVGKTLRSVKVRFTEWVGLPTWSTYYAAYGSTYTNANAYTANVALLNGNLKNQSSGTQALFSRFGPGVTIPPTPVASPIVAVMPSYYTYNNYFLFNGGYVMSTDLISRPLQSSAPATATDYLLKITLQKDFGHNGFAKLLTETVIFNANPDNKNKNKPIPNQPYTPLAKELLIDYEATTNSVSLIDASTDSYTQTAQQLQFFHLGAFGHADQHPFLRQGLAFLDNSDRQHTYLLPQYQAEGTFFLGLTNVGPREKVNLLCQMAVGSANPEREAPLIDWSVLASNQWRKLTEEEVLADASNHLLTSGIVTFYFPAEATTDNTLMEPGLLWLKGELKTRGEVPGPAPIDSVCKFIALHPQAVQAVFRDANNDPSHYIQPLAAKTIKKSRQGLGAVKSIAQPYVSFGGQPQEDQAMFCTRVSERLRHKQRALGIWDYEHLVLQAFPAVYKVKCLNHTHLTGETLDELAPGHVTLVVIPDLRNRNAVNPLEPKVDLGTLEQITQFLQQHAGLFVAIKTANPVYEQIQLDFQVRFVRGYAFATHQKVLRQALTAYLAPWAFDTLADVPFGGTLTKSVLINFIERLEYVDFVTQVKLKHFVGNAQIGGDELETVSASSARAVLVSCPNHLIREFVNC